MSVRPPLHDDANDDGSDFGCLVLLAFMLVSAIVGIIWLAANALYYAGRITGRLP